MANSYHVSSTVCPPDMTFNFNHLFLIFDLNLTMADPNADESDGLLQAVKIHFHGLIRKDSTAKDLFFQIYDT